MKIIAFAGSSSRTSINKKLVSYVAHQFENQTIEILDLNDYEAPLYSIDRENDGGIPTLIIEFAEKISNADLILLSLAEHNGAYSAAFKNLYDWISRIKGRKIFDNKPVLLMATSPGARGGASVLEIAQDRIPRDGGILKGALSLPSFHENFQNDEIVHAEKKAEFLNAVRAVMSEMGMQ